MSPPGGVRGDTGVAGGTVGTGRPLPRPLGVEQLAAAPARAAGPAASAAAPVPADSDCRRASMAASVASSNLSISLLMMAVRQDQSTWPGPARAPTGQVSRHAGKQAGRQSKISK